MNTVSKLVVVAALIAAASNAYATTIVEYQASSSQGVTGQNQPLAKIVVGSANVPIGGLGVYGQARVDGNFKWVIFDSTTPSAPVYLSALQPVTGSPGSYASNARWYDSPSMNVTLLANHTYAIGVLSDRVGTNSFYWGSTFSAFGGGATTTAGGLSLPFMQALCNSGLSGGALVNNPTLYTVNNSNRYQMSVRLLTPVPEPATLLLLGLGGLALSIRRQPA